MSTKLQTSNIGDSDCDLLSWGQKKSPNVKIGANSLIVLSGELIVTKSSNYARLPHTGLPDKNNFQLLADALLFRIRHYYATSSTIHFNTTNKFSWRNKYTTLTSGKRQQLP
jgi:hypothetical protein